MNIQYKEKIDDVNFKEVHNIINKSFDEKSDYLKTETKFKNSQYFEFAYDKDKLIGVARALSDNHEWSIIYDVAVLLEYQDKGIDEEIIKRLIKQLKGQHIFTYTNPKNISFYENLEFKRSKTAFTYVGLNNLNSYYDENGYFLPKGYRFETEFYPNTFPSGKKSRLHPDAIITYKESNENIDFNRINEILSNAFGGNERDISVTKDVFSNSSNYEFAYDGDKLVGVSRAISDGVSEAIILNVAVDPEYQGHHIGLNLVIKLSEQLKGQNVFLNTHPGGVGFYNREGFRRNKTAFAYMGDSNMPKERDVLFNLPIGYRFPDEL